MTLISDFLLSLKTQRAYRPKEGNDNQLFLFMIIRDTNIQLHRLVKGDLNHAHDLESIVHSLSC